MYHKTIKEIKAELGTSSEGLTTDEVHKRAKKYGKNILPKKEKDSIWKIFLREFKDPMIILLLFAIAASFIVGEFIDAIVILVIVVIDALMGTYQENKANNTAEALAELVTTKVKVVRNGEMVSVNAEDLTVGDYVLLESGDKISADMRIVEAHNLTVDESILTGESVQVNKDSKVLENDNVVIAEQSNMLFSGTTVVTGRAKAIVVGIGLNTEIGKIADSINNTKEEKSPLTIRVEKLSKQISLLVLIVAIVIAVLLIVKGVPYHEIFLSVIALAVSAMPEGLPLALTMALTIASNKMAKKNVIVRKLKSAESLGSCTVIASDKTGTLTVNEQTAKKIMLPDGSEYEVSGTGFDFEGEVTGKNIELAKEIAYLGVINNEATVDEKHRIGDSIDIAFKVLGRKLGISPEAADLKILEMIPYESENKYSAVFYEQDGEVYCTVKGSLEVVRAFCCNVNLVDEKLDLVALEKQNEKMASDGYRVISLANGKVARKDSYTAADIGKLTFMGMVGFIDPIRKEAAASIKECHTAGIKVLMITGDHPLTAFSIARDLKLADDYSEVTTGVEVDKEFEKGERSFDKYIQNKVVFARVAPLQKLKIVESLKRQGEFVAVTGDGVNDAPALKAANIGIAMGSGTDIARETADMIITDDNFKSIVAGIKEGRVAYANIRKIILFLVSCGFAEVLFFCLAILLDLPMPLVAIQLLWLNVVTDGIQDFALSFEKAEKGILREPPRDPKESIFNKELLQEIIASGLVVGGIVFTVWYFLLEKFNMGLPDARGHIMALMVFMQNIHVFNCRSEKKSIFSIPISNNWLILGGVAVTIILQIIVMEVPFLSNLLKIDTVPFSHLVCLFGVALLILIFMEIYKKIKAWRRR
ncbi:MAG: HAD-IC family P-type ATPase [Candidatus Saccharibacteria bacterium]|nr:HAD-IC family P-type ATPase [Candidatus Saccharibacteria bacterium]